MPKSRKSLKSPRKQAYRKQAGRCFYCSMPIWEDTPDHIVESLGLTPRQANQLKSTGEHLLAHAEDGESDCSNIVAACQYCNMHRHKAKNPLPPSKYRKYVKARLAKGLWHQLGSKMTEKYV
jgi:5-methylcytosine-specific restriction endonuclease McrA